MGNLTRKEITRRYRERHPEKTRAASAAWRAKHPGRQNEVSARYYAANKPKVKASKRRAMYGELPPEPLNCQGCGVLFADTKKGSCVDHDHTTGKVRGFLCNGCNLILGYAGDNIHKLESLIDYLLLS